MNRYLKFVLQLFADAVLAFAALVVTFLLLKTPENLSLTTILISYPCIIVILLYVFRCYNILWQYAHYGEVLHLVAAVASSIPAIIITQSAITSHFFDVKVYIVLFFVTFLLIFAEKCSIKILYDIKRKNSISDVGLNGNVMIIGGGNAASALVKEINSNNNNKRSRVKCIIDDAPNKIGAYIGGVKIVGDRNSIVENAKKFNISTIIFAIPSMEGEEKAKILEICQKTDCNLKTVPRITQFLDENDFGMHYVRSVEIEDLLGREPIKINAFDENNYVKDKVVLVTGGGGSIGSEICRQVAAHKPKQLIIFDIYENNAYDIQNELIKTYPELDLVALIGSVRDSKRLNEVFTKYHPQIVYHAAAHKHVPLMETSPNETIKNNVFGTYKTAECAGRYRVEKFVLISTDKAVNPTNIMGASKRICEMIVQTFNNKFDTEFVAVRFGNVLGSNGSVIPLFKKQIEEGGPVTVTHPEIIRYFMTIPEAVSLVIQAGATAKGGEIFVLDMGKPVKILTLAENLIKLSGLTPYVDIAIEFTGLRPGEKLYEELLMSEEGLQDTENKLIHIGKPINIDEQELLETLKTLKEVMYDDNADIRGLVKKIVPTYKYIH